MGLRFTCVALLTVAVTACNAPEPQVTEVADRGVYQRASIVFVNGSVYTADARRPWVEAVAVSDGFIVALGTDGELEQWIEAATQIVDLNGRLVLPGLYDSHLHPISGMAKELFQCNFPFTTTLEEAAESVANCAKEHSDWPWIAGGQWNAGVFDTMFPSKELLDAVVDDRPVYLSDATGHHAWVNSKALEIAGITDETENPPGGIIVRDQSSGDAVGTLMETATRLVADHVPAYLPEQIRQATLSIQQRMNAFGFVGMKSAATPLAHLEALKHLDDEQRLTMRVATHLSFIDPATDTARAAALERTIFSRDRFSSRLIRTDFIKLVLDGVAPSHTAAYLEPYADRPDYRGEVLISQPVLDELTSRFDSMGMTIMYHAAGDRAARAAIDAIAAARAANGDSGLRHEIGHAALIHRDDIARLARLGGVAEASPILWYPSAFIDRVHQRVMGEDRYNGAWPIRSFVDGGVMTIAGSDWPSAVASPNPWPAIEAMVTRRNPYGDIPNAVRGAEHAVPLEIAIAIYTRNGAEAMGIGELAGSIEIGKFADLIVLDRNIFKEPVEQISDTRVDMTIFEGKIVHSR